MTEERDTRRWFIDLDWLEQHDRSFLVLAANSLCSSCRQRLGEGGKAVSAAELIASVKDCCSQASEFISERSTVLESVFRLFLANGNQPLELAEIEKQLAERRGGVPHRTPEEFLARLLEHDQYYGLKPAES